MRHDLWFALRRIRLRPLHSAVIALTLGLGIGASLAVFAMVDAVLLRPLPYRHAGRLAQLNQRIPAPGFPELTFPDVTYRRIAAGARTLDAVAAWDTRDANLVGRDHTRRLIVAGVTRSLFDVLSVTPALGRAFSREEDLPNGPRALVLADWLWRAAFNADSGVIGSAVNIEGEPFTIVGVLPRWVAYPSRDVGAWEALRMDPAAINPFNNRYNLIARLRAGVSVDDARRDLTAPIQAVGREFPGPHPGSRLDPAGWTASVTPLANAVVGDVRPVLLLLLAGVLMLLLLTCANVPNLQLAGVMLRGEELAVRAALGATRGRLVRGALIEGILLTASGTALGLLLAATGSRLLAALMPAGITAAGPLLGARLLLFAVLVIAIVGAAVGAVPVAVVARRDPAQGLRDRAANATPVAANRLRRALAAAQVALAILLLHGAGLLIASAAAVQRQSLGFDPASVISMRINLPAATLRDRTARETLLRRLAGEISALPGVGAAGLVNALPLERGRYDQAMAVEGRPFAADGSDPMADYRVVSSGYFAAMDIGLIRGRLFTDDDANQQYTPVVISEALARRLFPDGEDPIGRRLKFGPVAPWMPIVAVVEDAKNRSLTEDPRPEMYLPGLGTWSSMAFRTEISVVARTRGDPGALAAPLRRVINAAAPDVAIYNVATMEDVVADAGARMRIVTRLMALYAAAALLLAMAGTYAVLAYLVTQRRRELAVRMALGAPPRAVIALVARESVALVGGGALAGLIGALALSRLLAGLLYGVGVLDLRIVLLVAAGAALTGIVAALTPARRATQVDPVTALRS